MTRRACSRGGNGAAEPASAGATVEKDWPFERVLVADKEYRAAYPDAPWRNGPLNKWIALHDLDVEEQRFQAGDRVALLAAVATCAWYDLVMPDWVATNFLTAYREVIHYEARSWDVAFGRPHKKRIRLARARERREKRWGVHLRCKALIDRGAVIDDGLFEQVGREFGLSKTVAQELYYEAEKWWSKPTSVGTAVAQALLTPYVVETDDEMARRRRRRRR